MPFEDMEPGRGRTGKDGSYTYLTDEASNPFGMTFPCDEAVPGYGDPNADLHLIGAGPEHGGNETGVPFTGDGAGEAVQDVLYRAGLLDEPYRDTPELDDLYWSYTAACPCAEPDELEPFFDAELRAVGAHVLLPVGDKAAEHVVRHYSSREKLLEDGVPYGAEVHGNGFLIVPLPDPATWGEGTADALVEQLEELTARDYRQVKAPLYTRDHPPHF